MTSILGAPVVLGLIMLATAIDVPFNWKRDGARELKVVPNSDIELEAASDDLIRRTSLDTRATMRYSKIGCHAELTTQRVYAFASLGPL